MKNEVGHPWCNKPQMFTYIKHYYQNGESVVLFREMSPLSIKTTKVVVVVYSGEWKKLGCPADLDDYSMEGSFPVVLKHLVHNITFQCKGPYYDTSFDQFAWMEDKSELETIKKVIGVQDFNKTIVTKEDFKEVHKEIASIHDKINIIVDMLESLRK